MLLEINEEDTAPSVKQDTLVGQTQRQMGGRKNGAKMRLDPEGPRADLQGFQEEEGEERRVTIGQDAWEGPGGRACTWWPHVGRGGRWRASAVRLEGARAGDLGSVRLHLCAVWGWRTRGWDVARPRTRGTQARSPGKSQSRCFSQAGGWGPGTSQQRSQARRPPGRGAGQESS